MNTKTEPQTEEIVLEIKLPVPVRELAEVTKAMVKIHGKTLMMRQVGQMLRLFKLKNAQ